ncbi:MAG: septation regulator SpoVG [Clostridia bacterium]|nr:septation regulator SpoVG [Clostridia bacterium]
MNITDVRIRKVNDDGKMKAIVSITFDDEFVVHDIKIIEGQNGLFIAMPSRKMGEGDFRDIAHPLVSETRNKIRDAIFEEYDKVLAQKATEETAGEPEGEPEEA